MDDDLNPDGEQEPEDSSYVCDSCGEDIVIPIDISGGRDQEYVEDCPVCCRANVIRVTLEEHGEISVSAHSE
ncbi:MAG: CPXCG motif-containing cysteine-rich protein [Planctomycetota bacterium]|nr:CPXCG motif-containing cysteine-rich protein [Planctomycetota bacterium]